MAQPPEPPGAPEEDEVERADHGALSPRGRGGDLSGTVSVGGPIKNARLVAWDGDRVTFTYRARQEEAEAGPASAQRITLPVADFLQRWLLHVPVPQTRVVRCYVAVSSDAHRGPGRLPHGTWASARRGPRESGLADAVCPAWEAPSRAVSHLWPAARVYGCHPAWRCALAGAGWRARGMKPTHARRQGEIGQGCGLSGAAQWCPGAGRDAVWGAHGPGSAPCGPTGEAGRACKAGRAWG